MRRHWLDNLRWVTVLSVLIYHVIYYYNNKGVFGGIGGFGGAQPQDVVMYILYPWFMMLLFLVAGISSYYALQRQSLGAFVRARTLKLLVPSTIGLFVLQWVTGYYNILTAEYVNQIAIFPALPEAIRLPVTYLICCVSGIGPLWFIQDLWLFSMLLALLRKFDRSDKLRQRCANISHWGILLLGVVVWLGAQTLITSPDVNSYSTAMPDGLYNLYKPFSYVVFFLMGYYVFSNESVLDKVVAMRKPMMALALASGLWLIVTTYGQNNTAPEYMVTVKNNLYAYLMILALIGIFRSRFDFTNRFASYMSRSSFGLYIVHYALVASVGYTLKVYTTLPPLAIYAILFVVVMAGSPLLYEILRRIPFVRWCIFGEKR